MMLCNCGASTLLWQVHGFSSRSCKPGRFPHLSAIAGAAGPSAHSATAWRTKLTSVDTVRHKIRSATQVSCRIFMDDIAKMSGNMDSVRRSLLSRYLSGCPSHRLDPHCCAEGRRVAADGATKMDDSTSAMLGSLSLAIGPPEQKRKV